MPRLPLRHAPRPSRLLALALALALPLQGCSIFGSWRITSGAAPYTEGSGTMTTIQRTVGTYHAVDASNGITVVVVPGDPGVVSVTADDNLLEQITTEVRDGTLYVGIRGGVRTNGELSVRLANSGLDSIAASTGATVTADTLSGSTLILSASTGARVEAGGRADSLKVDASTGGMANLRSLEAARVDVAISTGSTAHVYPTDSVSGECTGGGALLIRGKPRTNTVSTDFTSSMKDGQ
jgi:hypothetical protein